MEWFEVTLRAHPEIAVFMSLAIGYWCGGRRILGVRFGAVPFTLLAAIALGQLDISISENVKSVFFLLFLFAVGYGIGPQFIKGVATDGLQQSLFTFVLCVYCLFCSILAAWWLGGFDIGITVGVYAGSQTIFASMGLASEAISKMNVPEIERAAHLSGMSVAFAVTYIFGTIGSALFLAQIGPKLLGHNLTVACRHYEMKLGAGLEDEEEDSDNALWRRYELRTYRILEHSNLIGFSIREIETASPEHPIFIAGMKRDEKIIPAVNTTKVEAGDVLSVSGDRRAFAELSGEATSIVEIHDEALLSQPIGGVDVFVTRKNVHGKTLKQLDDELESPGVFIAKIRRGAQAAKIPVLPGTRIYRGDVITMTGLTRDVNKVAKDFGHVVKKTRLTDVAFIGAAVTIGALLGSLSVTVGGVPLTLSTAGGTLISGLAFGWLRTIHPTFGRIPPAALWFMNSFSLNMFIAVIGLSMGTAFIVGLKAMGLKLLLCGAVATILPLFLGILTARFIFRIHPALILGCVAGARTSSVALEMICEKAGSSIPTLGFSVPYAIGNAILTIWGVVLVMLLV